MPLLAQDEFGRVYQTEGLSEFDEAGVGYYAELDDTDNVYFGEMGLQEQRRLQALRKHRQRQARLRRIAHQRKVARLRRIAAQNAAKKRAVNARIRAAQDRVRRRQAAQKLARLKASRNAFAGYDQTTVGNPLEGWQDGQAIMRPTDWSKADLRGVGMGEEFGIANYHKVSHPLMGFDFGYYDDMDGMGFSKKFRRRLKRAVRKVTPKVVRKAVKDVSKVAGKVYQAPLKLANKVLTKVPLVKDVYKGVDKLTGGTLTSLNRTVLLPGEALKGRKITKAEFMESLVNVIKVGAIVVTGGTAVSLIGAGSSALAQGPLGKTSFGKTILSIGEIAALSSSKLGEMGLKKAMEKKAIDMASAHAASEAGKKAGALGAIAASAAVSAGAAGFTADGGKVPAVKADPNATAQAAKAAQSASNIAAQKAVEEIKKGAFKFDSQAAQAQFVKSAQEQAKKKIAHEFQKKTGIPLGVAADLAQGKVPSPSELRDKVKNEFYGKISDLENRIAQIPQQMSPNNPLYKKVLEDKAKLLAAELADRKALVAKVKNEAADRLVKANLDLKQKGLAAMAKQEALAALGKQHDELERKIKSGTANLSERAEWTKQLALLQAQIMKTKQEFDAGVDEAEKAAKLAEFEKERGEVLTLQAEFGGPGAREKYLGEGADGHDPYIHPMLRYGLVQKRA